MVDNVAICILFARVFCDLLSSVCYLFFLTMTPYNEWMNSKLLTLFAIAQLTLFATAQLAHLATYSIYYNG